ncbi:MAG: RDD family protein [Methylotenera sp.]|nr:RDD family protein [Flavobacterium sp.]
MTTKKLPLFLDNTFESLYGTFGGRLGALFLDWIFLSPIVIAVAIFNSMQLSNYYYTFIFSQLVILSYFTYLPVRYGATPGKRILGMTILKIDGSAISYRESFLKFFPQLVIGLLMFALQCYVISLTDEEIFNSLSWVKQSKYLQSQLPFHYLIVMVMGNGFNFANLLVFLLNERKRSIGDCVAGTVVVYTRFLKKIRDME